MFFAFQSILFHRQKTHMRLGLGFRCGSWPRIKAPSHEFHQGRFSFYKRAPLTTTDAANLKDSGRREV